MDDLSSVEWAVPKPAPVPQQYPQASGNYYPALRPTPPISGRSTPSGLQQNQSTLANGAARSNSSTPANDSFANLLGFNALKSSKGLSLQEQQKKLVEEKAGQEAQSRKAFDAQFGSSTAVPTSSSGRTSPNSITYPPTYSATSEYGGQKLSKIINKPFDKIPPAVPSRLASSSSQDETDLLAAFNASAPVDRSSYMAEALKANTDSQRSGNTGMNTEVGEDFPFGLFATSNKPSSARLGAADRNDADNDDVLGLLGRPLEEFARPTEASPPARELAEDGETHPQERAVAELVDMGFQSERSRTALETTESGLDVQAAVSWLLKQAHDESRKQKRPNGREGQPEDRTEMSQGRRAPGRRKSASRGAARPAWMRDRGGSSASQDRTDSLSPVNGEKDPAQYATDLGNKMFKTAGSLWKTGTKKLNQAVQEFNSDSESSQPKWMREAQTENGARKPNLPTRGSDVHDHERMDKKVQPPPSDPSATDEALMLEADARPARKSRAKPQPLPDRSHPEREQSRLQRSQPSGNNSFQPQLMQQVPALGAKAKLSKQAVEDESSQAYISPARRRRTTPKQAPIVAEPDLINESLTGPVKSLPSRPAPSPRLQKPSTSPAPFQPTLPKRSIPSLSSFALQASTKGRQEGNFAFKRGDYAQATTHYSSSLSALPSTHPLAIVILTNRALSHSKTGDPKASLTDAKSALSLIGSSRGAGEMIEFGGDEGSKQMSVYWEKTMMRQAEALEHLERWSDAAAIWRTCVEAGVGGATSSAGRIRCEKAAAPPSQSKASSGPKKIPVKPRPKPTALGDLAPDSESVTRLRAANAAADRLDDEKFALADVVDQRVSRWRAGKEGNLRALLSTLENVLWEDSGWKKVGMGDVLLPGKVKLVYMKGIAKVHPDKLPTTATTEQRMISAAVFATLNEAWERFKTENGL